jgi:hypothetical protein
MTPEERAVDPPRHVGIVSKTAKVSPVDLAFMAAALRIQVREHFAPAWGMAPIEVAAYQNAANLPPHLAAVIFLVGDDGNKESLGYHVDVGGVVFALVDVDQTRADGGEVSAVASHELTELLLNPHLDRWVWVPSLALFLWREAADPVEDLTYPILATIEGAQRVVTVSDFIKPEYFEPGGAGGWSGIGAAGDFLGKVAPLALSPGGYQIAKRANGQIVYLPERPGSAAGAASSTPARVAAKLARLTSRLAALSSTLPPA